MKRSIVFAIALLAAGAMQATPALAQQEDVSICEKESGDVAIAACDRAIASGKLTQSQLAWTYHNRGVEYEIKKMPDKALADYDAALKIDPNRPTSLVGRGNAYNNKGDYVRALADYNRSIELDHKSPNAFQNRGLCYYRMKDYDRARADYEEALALPPRNSSDNEAQTKARQQLDEILALQK